MRKWRDRLSVEGIGRIEGKRGQDRRSKGLLLSADDVAGPGGGSGGGFHAQDRAPQRPQGSYRRRLWRGVEPARAASARGAEGVR